MQRIAIIDIGSNSARLVISHIYKNGAYNMVYNQKEALRLSQKVDEKNMLTEVAFSSTIETMKSFAYMCKIYQADKTIAVATAAIRNAANGAELVARVAEETGIQLHIISGNTEAYITTDISRNAAANRRATGCSRLSTNSCDAISTTIRKWRLFLRKKNGASSKICKAHSQRPAMCSTSTSRPVADRADTL